MWLIVLSVVGFWSVSTLKPRNCCDNVQCYLKILMFNSCMSPSLGDTGAAAQFTMSQSLSDLETTLV